MHYILLRLHLLQMYQPVGRLRWSLEGIYKLVKGGTYW